MMRKCLKGFILSVALLYVLGLLPGKLDFLFGNMVPVVEAEETYTVTFKSEEGYILGEPEKKEYACQYTRGSTIWSNTHFTSTGDRPGYVLFGWKIQGEDDKIYNSIGGANANHFENIMEYEPTGDMTFVAVWKEACNVTFHSEEGYMNGVENEKDYTIEVALGSKLDCYASADREGYMIKGFTTNGDETLYVIDGIERENTIFEYVVTKDITFNIVWEQAYTVTFHSNEGYLYGQAEDKDFSFRVAKGEKIDKGVYMFAREGYIISGMTTEGDDIMYVETYLGVENTKSIYEYVVNTDVKFNIVWKEAWKVTYYSEEGFSDDNPVNPEDKEVVIYVEKGKKITQTPGAQRNGFSVTWIIDGDNDGVIYSIDDLCEYQPKSDTRFIAKWTESIEPENQDIVEPSPITLYNEEPNSENDIIDWETSYSKKTDTGIEWHLVLKPEYRNTEDFFRVYNFKIKYPKKDDLDIGWTYIYPRKNSDDTEWVGTYSFTQYGLNGSYDLVAYSYQYQNNNHIIGAIEDKMKIEISGLLPDTDCPVIDLSKARVFSNGNTNHNYSTGEVISFFIPITDKTSGIRAAGFTIRQILDDNYCKHYNSVILETEFLTKVEDGYIFSMPISEPGTYMVMSYQGMDQCRNTVSIDIADYRDDGKGEYTYEKNPKYSEYFNQLTFTVSQSDASDAEEVDTCKITFYSEIGGIGNNKEYHAESKDMIFNIKKGSGLNSYPATYRDGFIIKGWKIDGDDILYTDGERDIENSKDIWECIFTKDVTFIAQWVEAYNITLHSDEGYMGYDDIDCKDYTYRIEKGDHIYTTWNDARIGYTIVGWKVDDKIYSYSDNTETLWDYVPDRDMTLTAVWGEAWTVTFHADEGYLAGENPEDTDYVVNIEKGMCLNVVPCANRPGYECVGWKIEGKDSTLYVDNYEDDNNIFAFKPTSDVTFIAQWKKLETDNSQDDKNGNQQQQEQKQEEKKQEEQKQLESKKTDIKTDGVKDNSSENTGDSGNNTTNDAVKDYSAGDTATDNGNKYTVGADATVTYISPEDTTATTVIIPDTVNLNGKEYKVTDIAKGSFSNYDNLKSVTIGANVKTIGKDAYAGCKNLTTVTVNGSSLVTIEAGAFKNCKKLKTITINKNVITIGKNAFTGDKNLKTIVIKSKKIKSIGKNAFKNINKKSTIYVPKTLTKKQLAKYKKMIKKAGVSKSVKIKKK